ncbi:uncharacterized protein YbbK (DUF523 family) [Clostridiales Family XIII bacterium PM5-7]
MYIVSECLLGNKCKYNGKSNDNPKVVAFCETHHYLGVCPEVLGGLPIPRPPSEIVGDKVMDCHGNDVTEAFRIGAEVAWEKARNYAKEIGEEIEGAILQPRSPSCGKDQIYDGTFSGILTGGDGYFVRLLKENDIMVITDKEI